MPLSEDEVTEMAKRMEMDVDLETEIAWTKNELENAVKAEKSQVLAFRLHKRLRNDEAMQQNEKAVAELRRMIKYFRERLEQLKAD